MIAIQEIGKSFMGALGYNFKKLLNPDPKKRAEILATNFGSMDTKLIMQEIALVRSLRPNLNKYVYHTSINFSKEEEAVLSNKMMLSIAQDYLAASGYTNNQYFIFRHHDAGHPHIHLLVNRITFDGDVVSDSNNYKKSEAILRELEYRYNLIPVEQSNHRSANQSNYISAKQATTSPRYQDSDSTDQSHNLKATILDNSISSEPYNKKAPEQYNSRSTDQNNSKTEERGNNLSNRQNNHRSIKPYNRAAKRAPTKNEIEMVTRTGRPSDKMLVQALMKNILSEKHLTLPDLIKKAEQAGINLLFNRASTGWVSGITYFHNGFKIKGQALGNQFKWAELIKKINYEQIRDREAISAANSRTKTKYGDTSPNIEQPGTAGIQRGKGVTGLPEGTASNTYDSAQQLAVTGGIEDENPTGGKGSLATDQDIDNHVDSTADRSYNSFGNSYGIQIADDIDDEAIHGRNRQKRGKSGRNKR